MSIQNRSLFFGDNLEILRQKFPGKEGYFDLIYLDPPFNSNKNYNVLFKEGLVESEAQIHAFEDTWHWTEDANSTFQELVTDSAQTISDLMQALEKIVGHNDMLAYLTMMTVRLIELHRVLKHTGSLYLHCDPTASHYLKIVLDTIFGKQNFRNEIVWRRTSAHNDPQRFGRNGDRLLFYTKSNKYTFNPVLTEYDNSYIENFYRYKDKKGRYQLDNLTGPKINPRDPTWKNYSPSNVGRSWSVPKKAVNALVGLDRASKMSTSEKLDLLYENGYIEVSKKGTPRFKRYLDNMEGAPAQEIWDDIFPIGSQAKERLGYPTQKPETLLERIISASSNKDGWILDPFCGCGTTISVAERLNRNWVGIDISMLAINLIQARLTRQFYLKELKQKINVDGVPKDLAGAQELFNNDPFNFEYWALHAVDARPANSKTQENMRGADKGVDGIITFIKGFKGSNIIYGRLIVQIKGGHVQRNQIATLKGDVDREKADGGLFITLESPTKPMTQEAVDAGNFKVSFTLNEFPKIQILTIQDILNGKKPKLPIGLTESYFKEAQVIEIDPGQIPLSV